MRSEPMSNSPVVLQKEALMGQVAHQAVVMQFILEMASNTQQDPRGCFRQFFHKAKVRTVVHRRYHPPECDFCPRGEKKMMNCCCEPSWRHLLRVIVPFVGVQEGHDIYLDVFHTELEAFKRRVREHSGRGRGDRPTTTDQQSNGANYRLDPKGAQDAPSPVSALLFSQR